MMNETKTSETDETKGSRSTERNEGQDGKSIVIDGMGRGGSSLPRNESCNRPFPLRPQIEQTPIKKPTLDPCAPPEHLSAEARGWWNRIADAYELGPEHLLPLREALEAFDRCEAARKEIEATGLTVEDRFGQKRPNPLLAIERDSRSALLRAWRQIGLDIEPPGPVGYPAGRPRGGAA